MAFWAKLIVLSTLALALLGVGAWLRAGGLAGEARMQAELAAMHERFAGDSAVASRVEPDNDGKLVLMYGTPEIVAPAQLKEGRVVAPGMLVLETRVERYEKKDKKSSAAWAGTNGGERAYPSARLGAFAVAPGLLDRIQARQPFALDDATVAALGPKERIAPHALFYGGGTHGAPEVNDLRIDYFAAPNEELSVLAVQRGATLEREVRTYSAPLIFIEFDVGIALRGRHGADAMFERQRARIHEGAFLSLALGAVALAIAGYLAAVAAGTWFTRGRGPIRHPVTMLAIVLVWLAWLFMAWPLSVVEQRLITPFLAEPVPIALAVGVAAAALMALLATAHVAIAVHVGARSGGVARRRR